MPITIKSKRVFAYTAGLVFLACVALGCASSNKEIPEIAKGSFMSRPQFTPVETASLPEPDVAPPDPFFHNPPEGIIQQIQPGDSFEFRIVGTPIQGNVIVSLVGAVEIPVIDDYGFVQGMSPEEFRNFITQRFSKYVQNPSVILARTEYTPRVAYVIGLSQPRKTVELTDGSNLLNVLAEARWMPEIDSKMVVLFRKGRTRRIWLPHIYLRGVSEENVRILPDDVIMLIPERGVLLSGAARNPGRYFPDGEVPLTNFLLSAGGAVNNARIDSVHIFHVDNKEEKLDLRKPLEDVPMVGSGDIVYIPPSRYITVYAAGQMKTTDSNGNRYVPDGLRLSQYLAMFPPDRFGAALDKTSVIPSDGSEAIRLDAGALLEGDRTQPDPVIMPGTVVYIPPTRTMKFLLFLGKTARLFIPPVVEVKAQYLQNKPDMTNMKPVGPQPATREGEHTVRQYEGNK